MENMYTYFVKSCQCSFFPFVPLISFMILEGFRFQLLIQAYKQGLCFHFKHTVN